MTRIGGSLFLAALLCPGCAPSPTHARDEAGAPTVTVGSKKFTESVILGEIAARLIGDSGARVSHRRELGGTEVLWHALLRGDIDLYPEYTGTLAEEILGRALARAPSREPGAEPESARAGDAKRPPSDEELAEVLEKKGLRMGRSLGFDDTYAIGMRDEEAARLHIRTLSDLRAHPELKLGLSDEFMNRKDGWPTMRDAYDLPQNDVRGIDHDLAYRALASGAIDATDLYTTDAEIRYYHLRVLVDDRHRFPSYRAVFLYRIDLERRAPAAVAALARVEGRLTQAEMIRLNARAKLDRVPEARVAADFLEGAALAAAGPGPAATANDPAHDPAHDPAATANEPEHDPAATVATVDRSAHDEHRDGARPSRDLAGRLWQSTRSHLFLVGLSLLAAIVVAVPLGILAARRPRLGQAVLAVTGIIQTIPSLALLVFMIPLLGIGAPPAILALFLYSLLPIVRGTHAGLRGIPASILESADALGLPSLARLRRVELPMASPQILAGIKTSAVINVGAATLGAIIGAGGYGQPILTGIRLDDMGLILEGAIPAAVMALLVQLLFEQADRFLIPKGLRLSRRPPSE